MPTVQPRTQLSVHGLPIYDYLDDHRLIEGDWVRVSFADNTVVTSQVRIIIESVGDPYESSIYYRAYATKKDGVVIGLWRDRVFVNLVASNIQESLPVISVEEGDPTGSSSQPGTFFEHLMEDE